MSATFQEWMWRVDKILEDTAMVCTDDLPDCSYHDWWEDGVTPREAAARAIRDA